MSSTKKISEDPNNGMLLQEIDAISKALYLDKNPSRSSNSVPSRAQSVISGKHKLADPKSKFNRGNEIPQSKDKKSIWGWGPLKALSKSRKFNCCFSLQVHSVEGLPSSFNDASLCVHWKRRDGELVTRPAKVTQGMAEFEEKLSHTCWVNGSRSGPHHSVKYDAKHFLVYAAVYSRPQLDLGKHRVDLTRLLPLTLEELEEEKSSGSWTTSFKLSGKAKGATMIVSFGYSVVGNNSSKSQNRQNDLSTVKEMSKYGTGDSRSTLQRVASLRSNSNQRFLATSRSVENIKDLHEVLPASKSDLAHSVDGSDQNFDKHILDASADYEAELYKCNEKLEPSKETTGSLHTSGGKSTEKGCEGNDSSVIEQRTEFRSNKEMKPEEISPDISPVQGANFSVNVSELEADTGTYVASEEDVKIACHEEGTSTLGDDHVLQASGSKEDEKCTKESVMEELESALSSLSKLEAAGLDSSEDDPSNIEPLSDSKMSRMARSRSLDNVTESVAGEFLDMLGIEHSPFGLSSESDPESPRERLLRQFEKETLASGSLFNLEMGDADQAEWDYDVSNIEGSENSAEGFDLSSIIQAAEEELQIAAQAEKSKTRAKTLEDLETEALMQEWGLNEKAFQCSPPKNSAGFGSPIDLPPEDPIELPPLGEGIGPYLQTKDGGFLRSMNPELFSNAKSGGSLVMQISNPVVVPAEMGSSITEILQRLASIGIEKLSMQANKLMPLENITGKTMQQVAWEAAPSLEGPERHHSLEHEFGLDQHLSGGGQKRKKGRLSGIGSDNFSSRPVREDMESEFGSLEDLAPLAMDKIEALSIEGLRIQSGMSDEAAPSNIRAQSIGEISALQGKDVSMSGALGLEGTGGLQLLDVKDNGEEVDGLMGLSLTLDEWMRLDSGDFADGDEINERTSKILAAHHANSLDFIRGGAKGEKRRGKSNKKCGLLGNNFTVALMVQLRDPLRNYEPVGAPMLALVQVERVFVPPKQKIYSTVSEFRIDEEDRESESVVKDEMEEKPIEEKIPSEEESIPQFKITEVHLAGLKTKPGKKKLWGSSTQEQSGSRWLLANGMGKGNKHPLMKARAASKSSAPTTTKVRPVDTLWSISSRVHGTRSK